MTDAIVARKTSPTTDHSGVADMSTPSQQRAYPVAYVGTVAQQMRCIKRTVNGARARPL
jgi:hypothetical protein